jgi:hypothetical protein
MALLSTQTFQTCTLKQSCDDLAPESEFASTLVSDQSSSKSWIQISLVGQLPLKGGVAVTFCDPIQCSVIDTKPGTLPCMERSENAIGGTNQGISLCTDIRIVLLDR